MQYEMNEVEATLGLTPIPTVYLKTLTLPGIHTYLASQFIDCAARGESVGIGPNWDDEQPVFISQSEVQQFALWIREQVGKKNGRFETIWIVSDEKDPF